MRYDWSNIKTRCGETLEISAREIAPLVLKLIQPKSIIDVGCGNGTLLRVFRDNGIKDILGIDGPWVSKKNLLIEPDQFFTFDLINPLSLGRTFNLVVSLEVAEHIPPEKAEQFVEILTNLGPVILFSAAVPFQGGDKHINEQWPDYWKDIFSKYKYEMIDYLRIRLWDNPKVKWWLAQNMFFYIKMPYIERYPELFKQLEKGLSMPLRCIHPKLYIQKMEISPGKQFKQILKRYQRKFFK